MESDFARILGLFLILLMVGFYYREALKSIFNTPKESFILALPICLLGVLFYLFFKSKGF
jgi:uncharacterized membrane protein